MGDAPEGSGADIDIGQRLDLAGAVDDGGQVLPGYLAGGDFGDVGLSVENAGNDDSSQDQDDRDDDDDLFSAHCCFLRASGDKPEALLEK